MKNLLLKIHHFFVKLPIVWFVLIMVASKFLIGFILTPIGYLLHDKIYISSFYFKIPFVLLLILLIPFAFLETIIFQYLVIKILRKIKYFKNKIIIIVLISSFLFGIAHAYSLTYQIFAFFIGITLAYSYIVSEEKKLSPILIVSIIHYLDNAITFIIFYAFYIWKI